MLRLAPRYSAVFRLSPAQTWHRRVAPLIIVLGFAPMSLDFTLSKMAVVDVYDANITHNLGPMAREAGIYQCLWRPKELGITTAQQMIQPLREGLAKLRERPEHFTKFDSPNGWGLYVNFVPWVEGVLAACEEHPDAKVSVWV